MKEQVIVFQGEQMFVAPKKRISNKQKGVQVEVPEVYADGDPVPPTEPAEPVRVITTPPSGSGDIGVRTPQTFDTQLPPPNPPTNMGIEPPKKPMSSEPMLLAPVELGNPTRKTPPAGVEQPTPPAPPAPPTPTKPVDILIKKEIVAPLGLGAVPVMGGGGGFGGGGGGAEEEGVPVEEKKSYWWLWLLLIGGAAYYYSKKKK